MMPREQVWNTKIGEIRRVGLDWIKFKEDDYEDEGDFLHAIEEQQRRKKNMKIIEEEQNAVWTLKKVLKRRGINDIQ